MARRALAAASLTALTLCAVTLAVDDTPSGPGAATPLGYAAPVTEPEPDALLSSATRPQSGGPLAVRIPDLLAPPTADEQPTPVDDAADEAPATAAGDGDNEPRGPLRDVANLLFDAGFEDGLGDWGTHDGGSIDIVDSPVREGGNAVRLTAQDGGGGNARTQLDGPVLFDEGDEAYVGWSTYFPTDLPEIPGWFVFFEFHGRPHNGSPLPGTFGLDDGGDQLSYSRSEQYGYDTPWSAPLQKGRWTDFVLRVKFSKSEDVGFVELWVDGRKQSFDGGERLYQSTIMSDQNDGLYPIATNYFEGGSVGEDVTLYHDAIRVAGTYDDAAPGER